MFKNFISFTKCITTYPPFSYSNRIYFNPFRFLSTLHQFKFNDVINYPKREIQREARIGLPIERKSTLPAKTNGRGKRYYEILGVNQNATPQEIKKAYYILAKQLHPDSSKMYRSPESDKKFQELSEAYRILSDENKRREYDVYGIVQNRRKSISGLKASRNDEILHKMFSEAGYVRESKEFDPPANKLPVEVTLKLTLAQSIQGLTKSIPVKVQTKCQMCSRQFAIKKNMVLCKKCSGTGLAKSTRTRTVCQTCNGLRMVPKTTCHLCKDNGTTISTEQVEVTIRPGIRSGETIRISKSHMKQPVDVRVVVEPSDEFQRIGNDIVSTVPISITQAVLGGPIKVRGIDGKMNTITLETGIESDAKVRIVGKGVKVDDTTIGDHIINFKIKMPKILTAKQRALMTAFGNLENDEVGIRAEIRSYRIREELADLHSIYK